MEISCVSKHRIALPASRALLSETTLLFSSDKGQAKCWEQSDERSTYDVLHILASLCVLENPRRSLKSKRRRRRARERSNVPSLTNQTYDSGHCFCIFLEQCSLRASFHVELYRKPTSSFSVKKFRNFLILFWKCSNFWLLYTKVLLTLLSGNCIVIVWFLAIIFRGRKVSTRDKCIVHWYNTKKMFQGEMYSLMNNRLSNQQS